MWIVIELFVIVGIVAFLVSFNVSNNLASDNNNNVPSEETSGNSGLSEDALISNHAVVIKGFAFSPSELRIKIGEKVEWTNMDSSSHTVTSDSGNELNSGTLSKGESYTHTFNALGTYEYYCTIHPNMKAKIIVE